MRRRWLAGLVLAVLLLGSSATSADPTNWGQLAQIILWLQQIDQTLRDLNVVVDDIRGNLAQVYPEAGLRQIETLFEPVDSIRKEVEKLACSWRFTPRVNKLRFALFGGGSLGRSRLSMSTRFLVLRKLASSGVAVCGAGSSLNLAVIARLRSISRSRSPGSTSGTASASSIRCQSC